MGQYLATTTPPTEIRQTITNKPPMEQRLRELQIIADSINADTTKLEAQSEKLLTELNERVPNPQLIKAAEAYFDAQNECNIPPLILWLSSKKREKCKNARIAAFNEAAILVQNIIEVQEINSLQKKINTQIKDLKITKECQS
jgi:hypothetical protein